MIDKKKLIAEQLKLAKKISIKDDFEKAELFAGCDTAYTGNKIIAAVIVLDKEGRIIEKKHAVDAITFPYIPGLLAYRDSKAIIAAFQKLENKPDILFINANGILHPRRIGMASHLGLLLDTATIGIAKHLLIGKIVDGKVYDKDEVLASAQVSKKGANPIFISPGHKIGFRSSIEFTKKFMKEHKLPEPLHLAHRYANSIKKSLKKQAQSE